MAIKDKNIELGLNGITKPEPITLPTAQPSSNNLELYGREDTGIPPTQDPSSVYLDEIQKAASEKNYKALLQNDIAAYNLKMNTQKNLNNELAAQGFGTQGYGTSAHIGVENQAQNLYAQNLEGYNQAESDALLAAQDRQSAAGNENDNQLATFLQYSDGSEESIAGYMFKYGYTKNNDGVWVDKDGNPASAYIQAAAQSASEQSGKTSAYSKYSSLIASGKENNALSAKDLAQVANPEFRDVFGISQITKAIQTGEIKDGTVIRFPRAIEGNQFWVYINGMLFPSTKGIWAASDDRYGD